jgi:hypothetical protein
MQLIVLCDLLCVELSSDTVFVADCNFNCVRDIGVVLLLYLLLGMRFASCVIYCTCSPVLRHINDFLYIFMTPVTH